MKLLAVLFALVSLGIFAPNLYADPMLTVNAGAAGGALVETQVGNVYTWVYTDTTATGVLPATVDNNIFTATYAYVPLGISVLNVTDVCANVGVLTAATPCNLGFSFSDTAVGAGYLDGSNTLALLGNLNLALGADINIGIGDGTIGADPLNALASIDIGGGTGQIDFGQPSAPPSATPEPGSLSLLGTGLLGMAGVIRKKFFAA